MSQNASVVGIRPRQQLWNRHYMILVLVSSIINISSFTMITVLPLYMIEIGGNNVSAGTLMMIMTFSALIFRPVFGKMTDRQGRRLVLVIGLAIFTLATFGLVLAENILLVYGIRFLQGIGLSAFSTSMGTILSDVVPHDRLGEGVGYFGLSGTLATAIGPVFGLYLIEHQGYTVSYWISGGISLVSVILALSLNYEKDPIYQTNLHHQEDEGDGGGILGFIEKTSIRPCLVVLFVILAISSVFTFMPLFALERKIENIGLFFTVYSIAMVLVRVFGGRLVDLYGYFKVYMPTIIITLMLFITLTFAWTLPMVLLAAVFYGIGFGTVQPIFNTMVLRMSPKHRKGAANATYYATMDMGFGLGAFAWGVVSQYFSFTAVFMICSLLILFSIYLYFRILHNVAE